MLIYLCLGDKFRKLMLVSPMNMDVGDNLIPSWDWISSHDLRQLYADGRVCLLSGSEQLQLKLLPRAPARRYARCW